jgi:hypothetical protein
MTVLAPTGWSPSGIGWDCRPAGSIADFGSVPNTPKEPSPSFVTTHKATPQASCQCFRRVAARLRTLADGNNYAAVVTPIDFIVSPERPDEEPHATSHQAPARPEGGAA